MKIHPILDLSLRAAFCAAASWAVYKFTFQILTIFTVILWAFMFATPIINSIENYWAWQKRQPYEKWNGEYYEFAHIQIRVVELADTVGNKRLWFAAADVLKVIGHKANLSFSRLYTEAEYCELEDENFAAFSEAGVKKLLMSSPHIESKRMMLWIEREVIKPQRRRLELATTTEKSQAI